VASPSGKRPGRPVGKPPLLSRHAMVYSPDADRTILFGGWDGTAPNNFKAGTWIFDLGAGTWTNVTPGT